jgi:hypothetical protein
MSRPLVKAVGYGLLAGGIVIVAGEYFGVYLTGGLGDFQEALNPSSLHNIARLYPLMPGPVVIWLANSMNSKQ